MSLFEEELSVPIADLRYRFIGHPSIPWAEFWLNPRRLRGSDFLMRWSQGEWSETRLLDAVNESESYTAIPYGPSGVAPDDPREFELYFERLDKAGLTGMKRPDLLIFRRSDSDFVSRLVERLGGLAELPFTSEDNSLMRQLLAKAVIAVESENSLWVSQAMPDFGTILSPQKRLGGRLGLKKTAFVPTVIVKEEDLGRLLEWQKQRGIPIHVWHVFYDAAYGMPLDKLVELIDLGLIEVSIQVFQAPGGATTKKKLYKVYYHYTYPLGQTEGKVKLIGTDPFDAGLADLGAISAGTRACGAARQCPARYPSGSLPCKGPLDG